MTPPPAKKTIEVRGDQGDDQQYPIPGLDDDLLQKFSQERAWYLQVYSSLFLKLIESSCCREWFHCLHSFSFLFLRIWRLTSRLQLQTKTMRATGLFKSASGCSQFACKHQANLHHQTRKKVISGGREGSEKSHMFFP